MPITTGQRVQVETFSDDVWGTVTAVYSNGFDFQGDNWSMPFFFTFKAILQIQVLSA